MGYQDCEERREGRDYLLGANDAKDMPYLRDNEGGEDNRGQGKKFAFGKKKRSDLTSQYFWGRFLNSSFSPSHHLHKQNLNHLLVKNI